MSSSKPWHKPTFMTLGVASFLIYAAIGVKNFYTTKGANARASTAEGEAKQARLDQIGESQRTRTAIEQMQVSVNALVENPKSSKKQKQEAQIVATQLPLLQLTNPQFVTLVRNWMVKPRARLNKFDRDLHAVEPGDASTTQMLVRMLYIEYKGTYHKDSLSYRNELLRRLGRESHSPVEIYIQAIEDGPDKYRPYWFKAILDEIESLTNELDAAIQPH